MNKSFTETEAFALDLAKRTLYTGVEAGVAAGVLLYSSGGIDLSDPHKALATGAVAVGGGFLAAVRASLAKAFGKGGSDRATSIDLVREDEAVIANRVHKALASHGFDVDEVHVTKSRPPLVTGTLAPEQTPLYDQEADEPVKSRPLPGPGVVPSATETADDGTEQADEPEETTGSASVELEPAADDSEPVLVPATEPVPATQVVYDADGNALGTVESAAITNGESA